MCVVVSVCSSDAEGEIEAPEGEDSSQPSAYSHARREASAAKRKGLVEVEAQGSRDPTDIDSVCSQELGDQDSSDGGSDMSRGRRVPHRNGRARKKKAKRAFRLKCKQFAITYPQCPVDRATFDAAFKLKFSPDELTSAREQHKDGSYHLHLFVSYKRAVDVQSARHFDVSVGPAAGVQTYHGNTQKCKSRAAWLAYISKGDDHGVIDGDIGYDPLQEPIGKSKSMWVDYEWRQQFRAMRQLTPIDYPIKLVTADKTYEMFAPDPRTKKRSWWIVAPPNAGKTRWLNHTFAGKSIYSPRSGPYPFEGYADQDIIVYDDREGVSFAEFASVLNTWAIIMPIAGQIRYTTKNWKLNHTRNIIVLSNKTIENSMEIDDHLRMKKRFIQIVNPVLMDPNDKSDDEEEECKVVDSEGAAQFA